MTLFLWHMTAYLCAVLVLWPLGLAASTTARRRGGCNGPSSSGSRRLFLLGLIAVFGRFERPRARRADPPATDECSARGCYLRSTVDRSRGPNDDRQGRAGGRSRWRPPGSSRWRGGSRAGLAVPAVAHPARAAPRSADRDLAVRLGLSSIPGDPILAVGVAASILAVGGFLLLLRAAFHGRVGVAPVAALVVAAHGLLLGLPLLFSRDVYSYAFYGRIAGVYGGNPYVQTPLDHPTDALWRFVGPIWVNTPAVYGPAWSSLSAGLSTWLRARPIRTVEAYRMIALLASLATCARDRVDRAPSLAGADRVRAGGVRRQPRRRLLLGRERAQRRARGARRSRAAFACVVSHREMPAVALLTVGRLDQGDRGPAADAAAGVVHRAAQAGAALARAITHVGLAAAIAAGVLAAVLPAAGSDARHARVGGPLGVAGAGRGRARAWSTS